MTLSPEALLLGAVQFVAVAGVAVMGFLMRRVVQQADQSIREARESIEGLRSEFRVQSATLSTHAERLAVGSETFRTLGRDLVKLESRVEKQEGSLALVQQAVATAHSRIDNMERDR